MTHLERFPLTTGIVVDRRAMRHVAAHERLADLAALANGHRGACAFGKIAVIAHDGIHAFQVMPDGRTTPAFCGNSTAAAIACMGLSSDLLTRVHGPGSNTYSIVGGATGEAVSQTWYIPAPVLEEIAWRGRKVVLVRALNDYAIVVGSLPDGYAPEEARTELLGHAGCGKLAVVVPGEVPLLRFFNSNGQHGAAPQTGLASIALAVASLGWFAHMFPARRARFTTSIGTRTVDLPRLRPSGEGTCELAIGPISVETFPLLAERAA